MRRRPEESVKDMAKHDLVAVRRALISVSDKRGLARFGGVLAARGVELVASGGTARALAAEGLEVRDIAALTGYPEMMGGRVKTLHPAIHGGILARRDVDEDRRAMERQGIAAIDLVAVTLYPFEEMLAAGADFATCVENIDIGGPALIRAAAKNHAFVTVATDPEDYPEILAALEADDGCTTAALRARLAGSAYARTAAYDAAIAQWLAHRLDQPFPRHTAFGGVRARTMRYGENPHQEAALYRTGADRPGPATARQIQGKPLSYNNVGDADAAFALVAEFDRPAIAIIKHANPCGVATAPGLVEAHAAALACDPTSAFGGIVAANRRLDAAAARAIAAVFIEVVIAPAIDDDARAVLAAKANIRVLETGGLPDPAAPGLAVRSIAGGLLVQDDDAVRLDPAALKVVTRRAPSDVERADLAFAFSVAKHVKSNAIVYARNGATVGIGAGQMSRIDSVRIAAAKAAEAARAAGLDAPATRGSVVASDAFFPFADGLIAAAEAGARAVIQPGGSIRDAEIIAAADERGLAMVFTGHRHFRH